MADTRGSTATPTAWMTVDGEIKKLYPPRCVFVLDDFMHIWRCSVNSQACSGLVRWSSENTSTDDCPSKHKCTEVNPLMTSSIGGFTVDILEAVSTIIFIFILDNSSRFEKSHRFCFCSASAASACRSDFQICLK